jgi:hypothetical protein
MRTLYNRLSIENKRDVLNFVIMAFIINIVIIMIVFYFLFFPEKGFI